MTKFIAGLLLGICLVSLPSAALELDMHFMRRMLTEIQDQLNHIMDGLERIENSQECV